MDNSLSLATKNGMGSNPGSFQSMIFYQFLFHILFMFSCVHLFLILCKYGYLINEFDFWKVHGIMNTSGLFQSK